MYYDDYIVDRAEQAFDFEQAEFKLYDENGTEIGRFLDNDELNERMFVGVMREMVDYLYEKQRSLSENGSMDLLFDAENVENIFITTTALDAPVVVVEYYELPEWFKMENADLREYYWHPRPALSGEWSGAYFQPR